MKLLIVCTANICRSPMAETVARQTLEAMGLRGKVTVASAGTRARHPGERMDPRAVAALERRGYRVDRRVSRRVRAEDFEDFDLVLAMDPSHMDALRLLCPDHRRHTLRYFLPVVRADEAPAVPDPYYGTAEGFEEVLDLCETGVDALVAQGLVRPA
ncbi:MAG: low molecular weight phosphotyrosine protein phosphatase [Xylophilus ampelinus]